MKIEPAPSSSAGGCAKSLRICYINVVGPLGWHRFLYKQCRGLAERGCQVDFYTRTDRAQKIYGVQVMPVPMPRIRALRGASIFRLLPALVAGRYDIINVVNPELLPLALVLKSITRTRVVFDCQEAWEEFVSHKFTNRIMQSVITMGLRGFLSICSRRLDGFVFSDENMPADYRHLPPERQICFHNFPWLGMFPANPIPWSQRTYDLVYPGGLSRVRGMLVMLEAVRLLKARIPNIRALFIGPLPTEVKSEIDSFLHQHDLMANVELRDMMPYMEIPAILQDCKVGLVALLDDPKFHKNISGKIFDYMACGIPTVSVDLPPERAYIEPGRHGYLVPCGDAQAMAEAAYSILSSEEVGTRMSYSSRQHLEECGLYAEKEVGDLLRLYQYLLKHRR